ncbi:MAG: hypothetical protein A2W85_17170 [Bacteroidetes bacterium GWF2_41_31]|jgi:hypothetical protein|nr:MAG: hypothetical protein A2W85_17170 [Bacteroidetes bacterium GWF2_41_31]OFZ03593.1 MAG: hypothetical protein A2338_09010 [Bacteroidetes bacterium RIFOXYB12_FULL_41_6]
MEKPHRMAQVYGYIVCLVSVITFIICLANIIPAIIDRGDPMHAGSMYGMQNSPSLASFENYKMDVMKSMNKEGDGTQSFIPDDQTLRAMYEAAKDERIQNVLHSSNRTIMVSGIILVVSVLLFITHWIWLRRLAKQLISN